MDFNTERLFIRPVQSNDKVALFDYRSNSEANKFQGWIPKCIEDVEQFIGKTSKAPNIADTWFQLVVFERESNLLVGDVGLHFIGTENMQVEVGCTLNKVFLGKGFATETLKAIINYLFDVLGKHRVIASVDPGNDSSIRLMERLGFRKEGHFVEALFLNGRWVDDMVFGLLEKEWKFFKI